MMMEDEESQPNQDEEGREGGKDELGAMEVGDTYSLFSGGQMPEIDSSQIICPAWYVMTLEGGAVIVSDVDVFKTWRVNGKAEIWAILLEVRGGNPAKLDWPKFDISKVC